MDLTWYGTAGLVLREGERTLAFDPFCGIGLGQLKRPPQHLPFEEAFRAAEDVLITHGHFDHIYHLPRLYGQGTGRIFCTGAPARTLKRRGFDPARVQVIAPGWQGRFGPFAVRAFQGRHCRFDRALVVRTVFNRRFFAHPGHLARLLKLYMTYPERGETLLFDVECDGFRIQVMGSMGLDPQADYPTGADVLVLPYQGRSDLTTWALELVRRLAPKAVLLDHYDDTFPPITGEISLDGFAQTLRQELGVSCWTPRPGECLAWKTAREEKV